MRGLLEGMDLGSDDDSEELNFSGQQAFQLAMEDYIRERQS